MPGVAGSGFTVTVCEAAADEQPACTTVRVMLLLDVTVIDWVVSPVDQTLLTADEEVNTTDPPSQKVVAPPGVMDGVDGTGFTVTLVEADVAEHPAWVTVTK